MMTAKKAAGMIPWLSLARSNNHRTSKITDAAIRRAVGLMTAGRGARVLSDAVILAALRIAERDRKAWRDEVIKVETELHNPNPEADSD